MGLFLALLGGFFVWLMGRSFLRAWEMRSWAEVRCVILSSEIEERRHDEFSAPEFRHDISYGYEFGGKAYTGDHLTIRGSPWTSKREVAEERFSEYPEGMQVNCRVNPKAPEVSVLKMDSLAPGYSIWFPSLFVMGGVVIFWRALRPKAAAVDAIARS